MLEFPTEQAAYDAFVERYSDGLPVVLPTQERVARMLAGTGDGPARVLGQVFPSGNECTIRDVAINAVMAGAEPRQLRLIVAALEALLDERFNLNGIQSTTHCATPLVVFSGPLAFEAGMTAGNGVLGNGQRANLSIGRAIRLIMTNVGGGVPGQTDMSVQGQPAKISFCLAERLDADIWPPLVERQGGSRGETSVTVMGADSPICVGDHRSPSPQRLLRNVADAMRHLGSMSAARPTQMALILAPQHARICANAGWSVGEVQDFLFEHARNPLWRLRDGGEYDPVKTPKMASEYGDPEDADTRVPVFASPDRLVVVVAGGDSGGFSTVVPAWPASVAVHRFIDVGGSYAQPRAKRGEGVSA
jgi:hypothetical protein